MSEDVKSNSDHPKNDHPGTGRQEAEASLFQRGSSRGEELRQWQAQERKNLLQPLIALTCELICRLLMAHPGWLVQEQLHLDYASLEVAASPQAEVVLAEARWAEGHEWQGTGAVQICLPVCENFTVVGPPGRFAYVPGQRATMADGTLMDGTLMDGTLMDGVLSEVMRAVRLREHLPKGPTAGVQTPFPPD